MQKIKCPACLGTKEYPYVGNKCIRCDGRGYIDFGEPEQNTISRIMNARKEVNAHAGNINECLHSDDGQTAVEHIFKTS